MAAKPFNMLYDITGANAYSQTREAGGRRIYEGELPLGIAERGDALGYPRPSVSTLNPRDGVRTEKITYGDYLARSRKEFTYEMVDSLSQLVPETVLKFFPWVHTDSSQIQVILKEEINAIAPEAPYYAPAPNVQSTERSWTAEISYAHQGAEMNTQFYSTPAGQLAWAAKNRQVDSAIVRFVITKFWMRMLMAGGEERNRELYSSCVFSAGLANEIAKQQHFAVLFDDTGVAMRTMLDTASQSAGGLDLLLLDPVVYAMMKRNEEIGEMNGLTLSIMDSRAAGTGGMMELPLAPVKTVSDGKYVVHVDKGTVVGHPDNPPFYHLRRPTYYNYHAMFGPRRILSQIEKETDVRTHHLDVGMQNMRDATSKFERVKYSDSLANTYLWGDPLAPGFADEHPEKDGNGHLGFGGADPKGHFLSFHMDGNECRRSGDASHARNGRDEWVQVIGQIDPVHLRRPQLEKYIDSTMLRFYPDAAELARARTGLSALYKALYMLENQANQPLTTGKQLQHNTLPAKESPIDRIITSTGALELYMSALQEGNVKGRVPEGCCSVYAIMKLASGRWDSVLVPTLIAAVQKASEFIADFTNRFRSILGASHVVNKYMAPTNTPPEDIDEMGEDLAIMSLFVRPKRAIYYAREGKSSRNNDPVDSEIRVVSRSGFRGLAEKGPTRATGADGLRHLTAAQALGRYMEGAVFEDTAKVMLVTGPLAATKPAVLDTVKISLKGEASAVSNASMLFDIISNYENQFAISAALQFALPILAKFESMSEEAKEANISHMRAILLTIAAHKPSTKTEAKKLVQGIRSKRIALVPSKSTSSMWRDSASVLAKVEVSGKNKSATVSGQTAARAENTGTRHVAKTAWIRTPFVFVKSMNFSDIQSREVVAVDRTLNSGIPVDVKEAAFLNSNKLAENARRAADANGVNVGFDSTTAFMKMFDRRLAAGSKAGNTRQYLHLTENFLRRLYSCATRSNDPLRRAISLGYALLKVNTWYSIFRSLCAHVLLPINISACYVNMQIEAALGILTKRGGETGAVFMAGLSASVSRDNTSDIIRSKKAGHIEMIPMDRRKVRVLQPLAAVGVSGGCTLEPYRYPTLDEEGVCDQFRLPVAVRPSLLFMAVSDSEFDKMDGHPYDIVGATEEERSTAADFGTSARAIEHINYHQVDYSTRVLSSSKWFDEFWGISAHSRNVDGTFGTYSECCVSTYYNAREGQHTLYTHATGALKSNGWGSHAGRLYSGMVDTLPKAFDVRANIISH